MDLSKFNFQKEKKVDPNREIRMYLIRELSKALVSDGVDPELVSIVRKLRCEPSYPFQTGEGNSFNFDIGDPENVDGTAFPMGLPELVDKYTPFSIALPGDVSVSTYFSLPFMYRWWIDTGRAISGEPIRFRLRGSVNGLGNVGADAEFSVVITAQYPVGGDSGGEGERLVPKLVKLVDGHGSYADAYVYGDLLGTATDFVFDFELGYNEADGLNFFNDKYLERVLNGEVEGVTLDLALSDRITVYFGATEQAVFSNCHLEHAPAELLIQSTKQFDADALRPQYDRMDFDTAPSIHDASGDPATHADAEITFHEWRGYKDPYTGIVRSYFIFESYARPESYARRLWELVDYCLHDKNRVLFNDLYVYESLRVELPELYLELESRGVGLPDYAAVYEILYSES